MSRFSGPQYQGAMRDLRQSKRAEADNEATPADDMVTCPPGGLADRQVQPMKPRLGSLFSGYCGLDSAVCAFYDAETTWVSDIDPGACKILAHHYPHIPNLGDISAVDWASVEFVDILTGGFPCQDLSHAGKRQGMTGARSGLWSYMAEAINQLRPSLVVIENVRGILSASASSNLEPCPWCLGDSAQRGPNLRALGCVLGDLASIGYDAQWHGLRAADIGAPHGRFRVFVTAHPHRTVGHQRRLAAPGQTKGGRARPDTGRRDRTPDGVTLLPTPRVPMGNGPSQSELDAGDPKHRLETAVELLPTPRATDGTKGGPNQRGSSGDLMLPSAVQSLLPTPMSSDGERDSLTYGRGNLTLAGALLPTPAVNDMGDRPWAQEPGAWEAWTENQRAKHGNGNGHGPSLAIEAQRLLPTPRSQNGEDRNNLVWERPLDQPQNLENALARVPETNWGNYAAAIYRWESLTRSAPSPTVKGRLNPAFVEWMMGLPEGWVTDPAIGLTRNQQLKALGNGVVPQQAYAALSALDLLRAAA